MEEKMGGLGKADQDMTLGKWTLKKKLILLMVLSGLLPFLFFFFMSLKASKQEILALNENRLISIREAKKLQIESYFKQIENQIITMSNSFMVVDAMDRFTSAFHQIDDQMAGQSINESKLRERYSYQQENTPGTTSDAVDRWLPSGENSKILQSLYISENPHPIGEKHKLDAASGTTMYNEIHGQYHPNFRQYLEKFGYYDIFLVDAETGHIVYSVFKEVDFATSLISGPYKDSGIGRAFNAALSLDDPNSFALEDFKSYEPSYNAAASFIASPVFDMGEVIGVLIFQAPVDNINDVMTSHNKWKNVGLGDSGEVYLVGQDNLLRNNSRFLIEEPEEYFKLIEKLGVDPKIVNKQRTLNTSIGIASVNTPGANEALKGKTGFDIFPDYRNVPVLSAYAPVDIIGLKWGILAEIDEEEALLAYEDLKSSSINIGLVIMLVIGVVGYFISVRAMAPIERVTQIAQEIAKGNLNQKTFAIHSRDEIGILRNAFNKMIQNLNLFVEQAQEMADGKFQVKQCKENLEKGMDFNSATNFVEEKYQGTQGGLADALDNLTGNLRKLAVQSVAISGDQLDNEVLKESIQGELGESFSEMSRKMNWFAGQAGLIATNDLYNSSLKDDGHGTLGESMSTMVKNLRVNTTEMAKTESMMQQMPLNVMMANIEDFTITYMNPESFKTLKTIEQYLPVKVDDLKGQCIDILHKNPALQRKILADPKNLPHQAQIQVGPEILDLLVSPVLDENRNYLGPMVTWSIITQKLEMEKREKESAETMREVMMEVTGVVQTLGASSEELSSVSGEMGKNSQDTADQANQVSGSADEISKNVQTVATGTEEMSASIKEIASNSSEAAKVTADAVQAAEKANGIVSKLGDSSKEIGDVIKDITSIAEQTNLLALNATIEAARAGEAGKGFAVVANEVKELATQTSKATENISTKIQAIQTDTSQAVGSISEISDIVNRINDIATSIASMVEEQTATTNEMSRNVQEAATGSIQIAENTAEVAKAAGSTKQGADDTGIAAKELSKMSLDLQNLVAKFGMDEFIIWNDNYSVGVKEIDDQHKQLFELINQTHRVMTEKQGRDAGKKVIDGLVDYTIYHFSHEEGLMRKAEYSDYDEHIKKHEKLVGQVADFQKKFNSGEAEINQELMKFLKDWLSNHIMGQDKFYTSSMHDKGIH